MTRIALTVLFGASLAACGGSGSTSSESTSALSTGGGLQTFATSSAYVLQSRGTSIPSTLNNTTAAIVTNVRFEGTTSVSQTNVPVTFGQVFAPGHLSSTSSLIGRLENGATVPVQLDVKALHPDGSIRHAVLSVILPSLGAGEVRSMNLESAASGTATTAVSASQMLNSGFTTQVETVIGGVRYTANAADLIKAGKASIWLAGATANEWSISAPMTSDAGVTHPHLTARFNVRWYNAVQKARVDVVLENNWAYEAAPQTLTYDVQILVGGRVAYSKAAMQHYHHARWRKIFWFGGDAPEVNVKHNVRYLIDTKAFPNYDQSLTIPESSLNTLKTRWTANASMPMSTGLAVNYMPATGGRDDIGLLPSWAAMYLLSMDRRAREVTLGTADLAGSYSSHYRDKKTGQPISLIDYPYMTLFGQASDTYNPATKQREAFPACASPTACKTLLTADVSHQPAFAYLPYVLTGDHYYLEELQFWGMYNVFASNPGYRENIKGLLIREQVRGQAWALRTLAEAAYITPDNDRLKSHFNRILDSNLDWYNANYPNNPSANQLGAIVNGYAMGYANGRGLAPWMDDFFTQAVGHAHDLGFAKATSLLKYKAQFPIQRMIGAGACYIRGSMYTMLIRDSSTTPFYTTIGQAFQVSDTAELGANFTTLECGSAAMGAALKLKTGEMTGYSAAYAGYPSNMQPALAYAADIGGADGAKAWSVFMSRSVKPNYALGPQFNIVPR